MNPTPEILTGRTDKHLVAWEKSSFLVQPEVASALSRLKQKANKGGFDLQLVSSFRDYAHQLRIWNAKAEGKRPLLDANGEPLEFKRLSEEEIIFAILRWSALPGASRHHWGTDLDVIDSRRLPAGYQVKLVPSEVTGEGMFAPLHDWLDEHMGEEGFFRPYAKDLGGVSPERWHLSYAPLAESYLASYSLEMLRELTKSSQIALKEVVLDHLPEIYRRFVQKISPR
jgi:LAS superfamily LD-carboxypeptidase LdcB